MQVESETSSSSIKLLCPTRWTVRAYSLLSIIDNYSILLDTWDEVSEIARDTKTKARIQGVASQMKTFNFIFGTLLRETVLRHTDNLSKALQKKSCSAAEGLTIADMVIRTLSTLRSDCSFDLFWLKVQSFSEPLDITPQLPHCRKRPRRYEEGSAPSEFHDCPRRSLGSSTLMQLT